MSQKVHAAWYYFRHVWLCATLWTVVCQLHHTLGFSPREVVHFFWKKQLCFCFAFKTWAINAWLLGMLHLCAYVQVYAGGNERERAVTEFCVCAADQPFLCSSKSHSLLFESNRGALHQSGPVFSSFYHQSTFLYPAFILQKWAEISHPQSLYCCDIYQGFHFWILLSK